MYMAESPRFGHAGGQRLGTRFGNAGGQRLGIRPFRKRRWTVAGTRALRLSVRPAQAPHATLLSR